MLGRSIQRCRSLLPQLRGRCTPWCHMPCFSANTGPACGIGKLVRNHAMGAVEEMCAIISLLWPAFRKPLVGSVYREDGNGGRSTWLFPVTGTLRIKSGDVRTSGGTEVTAPGPTPAPKATCGVENNRLPARDGSSVGGGGPRMVASLSHCRRANRAPRYDACQGRSLFRKRTRTLRAHF